MHSVFIKIYFINILLAASVYTQAQKNIVISDSLAANAEQLDIKIDQQRLFKKWRLHLGEYAVAGTMGWGTSTTKGNFWGTKAETNEKQKFSFEMHNADNDTATVEAANHVVTKETHGFRFPSNFTWGNDQIDLWSQRFTALITLNADTTERWTLMMNGLMANDTAATQHEAYLFNDSSKKILLEFVTSNKNKEDKRMVPAYGYEFLEEGQPVCAIQYYGGGLLGRRRNIVWMDKRLDPKTKLVLVAAMIAVYQFKVEIQNF